MVSPVLPEARQESAFLRKALAQEKQEQIDGQEGYLGYTPTHQYASDFHL